jgi:POT family proton-dependent oligopeptide transporter
MLLIFDCFFERGSVIFLTNRKKRTVMQQNKHPAGLYILGIAETVDRMSYYGILSILVLYITKQFLFSNSQAYTTYGVYTALAFATPVLGGYLADRFFGLRYAIIVGMILITLGNFVLVFTPQIALYSGLSLVISGIGFFKGNATTQLGLCYRDQLGLRDSGYTLYYIGMNTGSIIGPIIFGLTALAFGSHLGFVISGISMLFAGVLYLIYGRYFAEHNNQPTYRPSAKVINLIGIPAVLALLTAIIFLFARPAIFPMVIALLGITLIVSLLLLLKRISVVEKKRVLVFVALTLFTIIIVAGEMQTGSAIMLYINQNVNHTILNHTIPVEFFSSLEPVSVIILAFLMSILLKRLGQYQHKVSTPFMFAIGLLLNTLSFVVFAFSAGVSVWHGINLPLWLILLGNLLLGAGDLCSTPYAMAAIEFLAPAGLKGSFMGIYFLASSFSGYFSSLMDKIGITLFHSTGKVIQANLYEHIFWLIAIITFAVTIIALLLAPQLKRMMAAK